MRLSHVLIKDGYLEVDSVVRFSDLRDTRVVKRDDGSQRVRMGRLLKTFRPLAESYCFNDLTACVEMITSDQVVADFLSLKCQTIEELIDQVNENRWATIWVLERIPLCGRQVFHVGPLSHGSESYLIDHQRAGYSDIEPGLLQSTHCTLVLVHAHPSLLMDYDKAAFELAESLEFFLNDAYVYQIFYPRRASEWRIGRFHEICSLVRSDYRQAYFPHLMRACAFMSEGLASFQSPWIS